jgi:hypothetical protein
VRLTLLLLLKVLLKGIYLFLTLDPTQSSSHSGPGHRTKAYSELMQSFSSLAADLPKIPHMCEIWLGMVQCAKNIAHETPKHEMQTKMLELTTKVRSTTEDVLTGAVDLGSTRKAIMDDLATEMSHNDDKIDISILPKKRSHKAFSGAVTVNRLKSCHERPQRKKEVPFGFCGWTLHRIEGCSFRKEMGSLVCITDTDQLVSELYQQTAPCFLPMHSILPGYHMFEQVPKDSNHICIHDYASPELGGADLSQGAGRDDTNYLCVTIIFPLNVRSDINTRCFVRTFQVVKWINQSKVNSKKVIVN